MEALALTFFPFPHVLAGERRPGFRFTWPERCNRCDQQCERNARPTVSICSYGVNYMHVAPDLIIFGVLVQSPTYSSTQKKLIRNNPKNVISAADLEEVSKTYQGSVGTLTRDIEAKKEQIIAEYTNTKRYEKDFLENLRPEIQKNLSFLHDYKQFIARVRQNINVVIEARYEGRNFEDKLARALPSEAAIYWASILMEEKLTTAFLLLNPDRITSPLEFVIFRLHGAVLKCLRIYNAGFEEKGVKVSVSGSSVGEIKGNPVALPVISHTLIDNALKYSKRGSEVRVEFRETQQETELTVTSYGPKIENDEMEKIFDIFYRGRSARDQEDEGAGFGLYLAQFIAKSAGTRISVSQESIPRNFGYATAFSVKFRRER
jgi:signal transduction histidine kinase